MAKLLSIVDYFSYLTKNAAYRQLLFVQIRRNDYRCFILQLLVIWKKVTIVTFSMATNHLC